MTIERVKPILKRVQPVRPPEFGMVLISSDPLVYKNEDGECFVKTFNQLFECFPSGYVKDRAEKPGFTVSYGKISRSITDRDKALADLIVERKMKEIFGENYDFWKQSIRLKEKGDHGNEEHSE